MAECNATTGELEWSRGLLLQGGRETLRRLYDANPQDGAAARDLAFSHGKVAQFHLQQREPTPALEHFRDCAVLLERLDATNNQDIRGALNQTRQMIQRLASGDSREDPAASVGDDPSAQILTIVRKVAADNHLDLAAMDLQQKAGLIVQVLEHLTGVKLAALPADQQQEFVAQAFQIAEQL